MNALFPVIILLLLSYCQSPRSASNESNKIVFEGRVIKIAPEPQAVSGGAAVYRLVKYEVERVCRGKLNDKQIIVDHLILDRSELKGIKEGDLLCVEVKTAKTLPTITYEPGIRNKGEKVKTYYDGWNAPKAVQHCDCSR